MERIYFDYASTTPVDERVTMAMLPYFTQKFGNPSSPHRYGLEAQKALEDSRAVLAQLLGAQRDEIIFTSGGTEANNLALIGAMRYSRRNKAQEQHLIVSRIEHSSVLATAQFLEQEGCRVTYLSVNQDGHISVDELRQAISPETFLVSVMHANHEIGTLQPIAEIGKLTKEKNILFHVDAVQTVGHLPIDVKLLNIDMLSLSAHKFYGPKGMGALYIRKGVKIDSCLLGGQQEQGMRASTQNVAGAVGLAKAIEICQTRMEREEQQQTKLRNFLIDGILKKIVGSRLNGHSQDRLPNNAHFAFEGIKSEELLVRLDMAGIAASMGSACQAGSMEPSPVLKAIGLSNDLAFGALRISLGRWTYKEHIEYLLEELIKAIQQLRR